MNPLDALVCIGRITKKWGFGHEVLIALKDGNAWPRKISEPVYVMIAHRPVPFFVHSSEPQGKKGVIVTFHDMSDFLLQTILQCDVFLSPVTQETGHTEIPQNTLVGYSVTDRSRGFIGTVFELMEREIQPLLVIVQDDVEVLIPYTPEIIRKTNHKKRTILIEAPEGLIDLYLNP
jgi:16S rRNA processing protein RimM